MQAQVIKKPVVYQGQEIFHKLADLLDIEPVAQPEIVVHCGSVVYPSRVLVSLTTSMCLKNGWIYVFVQTKSFVSRPLSDDGQGEANSFIWVADEKVADTSFTGQPIISGLEVYI